MEITNRWNNYSSFLIFSLFKIIISAIFHIIPFPTFFCSFYSIFYSLGMISTWRDHGLTFKLNPVDVDLK